MFTISLKPHYPWACREI